jgi:hypothetical protein
MLAGGCKCAIKQFWAWSLIKDLGRERGSRNLCGQHGTPAKLAHHFTAEYTPLRVLALVQVAVELWPLLHALRSVHLLSVCALCQADSRPGACAANNTHSKRPVIPS